MQIPLEGPHPSDIAWGITFDMKSGRTLGIMDVIEEKELQDKLKTDYEGQHWGYVVVNREYMNQTDRETFLPDYEDEKIN